jgi:hypothetical protein
MGKKTMRKRRKKRTSYDQRYEDDYPPYRRYRERGFRQSIKQFFVKLFIGLVTCFLIGLFLLLLILYFLNPTGFITTTIQILFYAAIVAGVLLLCAILYGTFLCRSSLKKDGRGTDCGCERKAGTASDKA